MVQVTDQHGLTTGIRMKPASRDDEIAVLFSPHLEWRVATGPEKLAFGPYEFETRTGRLWKHGTRVKLQPKSQAVLACLVEKAGEAVTRDELRDRLWASDVFTDFNLGINVAVKRLRDALCDSADDPIYIQTIP